MHNVVPLSFGGVPKAQSDASFVVISHAMAALHDMLAMMQAEDNDRARDALGALYHDKRITRAETNLLHRMLFGDVSPCH